MTGSFFEGRKESIAKPQKETIHKLKCTRLIKLRACKRPFTKGGQEFPPNPLRFMIGTSLAGCRTILFSSGGTYIQTDVNLVIRYRQNLLRTSCLRCRTSLIPCNYSLGVCEVIIFPAYLHAETEDHKTQQHREDQYNGDLGGDFNAAISHNCIR